MMCIVMRYLICVCDIYFSVDFIYRLNVTVQVIFLLQASEHASKCLKVSLSPSHKTNFDKMAKLSKGIIEHGTIVQEHPLGNSHRSIRSAFNSHRSITETSKPKNIFTIMEGKLKTSDSVDSIKWT